MLCLSGFELYSRWVPLSCLTRIITQKEGFTVQRMLINQNAVFLPGHACCIIYANNMIM